MILSDVNLFAVVGAAVVSFIVGMLWYGPVFGKAWMGMMGYTPDNMRNMRLTPMQAMIGGGVTTLLFCYIVGLFVGNLAVVGLSGALSLAFSLWLVLALTAIAGGYLWENRSPKLTAFNAVYHLVNLVVVTLILTVWQ
ncbi:DUF1761 domain-containing protein [Candidatus Parcubacteria bacterium]|nr:DUF1761 domain-containing protein [Candidatus Parcubacteria bacterium]